MSKTSYTISESYSLPSKGLIYDKPIDPGFTVRSMTTAEEMKRLSPTETPYKVMSEIIEDCLVKKLDIPVYDLCIGDYQFLLHKLRIVTYGPDYKMAIQCPNCGEVTVSKISLDSLNVQEYDNSIQGLNTLTLPQSGKRVELKIQTPRIIEEIMIKTKELKKKMKDTIIDPSLLVTLQHIIKTVDGQVLNVASLETFVRKLPMKDANILLQAAKKLNEKVGLDTEVVAKCGSCGYDVVTTFRPTSEFFGPTID
jgi:predicted RNA-binding Zn-ribbon protein involved in translation (DUF1610 family)